MSTHAAIIAQIRGKSVGIYCHSDGELAGVGEVLAKHYVDPLKIAELVGLGKLSRLGDEIATCFAYGRDRGEKHVAAVVGETWRAVAAKISHDGNIYVFENGLWFFCKDGGPLVHLLEVLPVDGPAP